MIIWQVKSLVALAGCITEVFLGREKLVRRIPSFRTMFLLQRQ
jgi:hypothetical protein